MRGFLFTFSLSIASLFRFPLLCLPFSLSHEYTLYSQEKRKLLGSFFFSRPQYSVETEKFNYIVTRFPTERKYFMFSIAKSLNQTPRIIQKPHISIRVYRATHTLTRTHIEHSTLCRYVGRALEQQPHSECIKISQQTDTQNKWSHFPTIRFKISSNWYSIGNMYYGEHNTI